MMWREGAGPVPDLDAGRPSPPDANEAAQALVGQTLGERYQIQEVLAVGGMGCIFRAVQRPLGRLVAFKTLHPQSGVQGSDEWKSRFLLEAATLARLNHANTVRLYDYGHLQQEDLYFMAMELVDGRTISRILHEDGPLPVRQALWTVFEVARSLAEAHDIGVVHRDLKPSNIMLVKDPEGDRIKVVDFGIVKVGGDNNGLTQLHQILGSPRYMSPEQIRHGAVDGRSDIYSLGIVLFEMLSGRVPFKGRTPMELMLGHLERPAPSVHQASGREVPEAVEKLVARCLSKEPQERPHSMRQLQSEIRAVLEGMGDFHRSDTATHTFSSTASGTVDRREVVKHLGPGAGPASAAGALRPTHVAAGLAAALGLAIIGFGLTRGPEAPHAATAAALSAPATAAPAPALEEAAAPAPTPAPTPATEAEAPPVMLQSDPPGAEVWHGGQHIGHTPFPIGRLGEVGGQKYQLRKENYRSASWTVPMDLQDTSRMIRLEPQAAGSRTPTRGVAERPRPSGGEIRLQR